MWIKKTTLAAIIIFAILVVSLLVIKGPAVINEYYGWKVTSSPVIKQNSHSSVAILSSTTLDIEWWNHYDQPPVIIINGKENNSEYEKGVFTTLYGWDMKKGTGTTRIYNLPVGWNKILINNDILDVHVYASEKQAKEAPGFKALAVFLVFIAMSMKLKQRRTGG